MFYALYAIASKEDGYNIITARCGRIFPRLRHALEFCRLIMLRVDVAVVILVVVVVVVVVFIVFVFVVVVFVFAVSDAVFVAAVLMSSPGLVRSYADRMCCLLYSRANNGVRLRDSYYTWILE